MSVHVSPFLKQLFVASSPMLAALSVGGASSYPIVLLHQLRLNDTSIELDFDTASWIGSIHGLSGLPTIFLPNIMQWRGRKLAFIAACFITIIGWIIAYNAKTAAAILVSESFHGLGSNSVLAVSYLSLSEMMAPEYRHPYMGIYGILQALTMAINGILTQYLHWRTISLIMAMPMVIAIAMAFAWPESPHWLAVKGQYKKCEKSFFWLRGADEFSRKELKELINANKEQTVTNRDDNISFRKLYKIICRRDFYLPCVHMIVLQYLFYWSGSFVIAIYSMELIQKSTQSSGASFYSALIMNMILSLGIVVNLTLQRFFKKKPILLVCTFIASISMLSASLISGLQTSGFIPKNSLLCLFALIVYMIAIGIGIYSSAYIIAIELMPVKHRGLGGALIVIFSCVFHTSSLKISAYLFLYINLWGTFLLFAINLVFCGIFVWKYVPDTSGKTLQELEYYYMYGDFVEIPRDEIETMSVEKEMKVLVFKNRNNTRDDMLNE